MDRKIIVDFLEDRAAWRQDRALGSPQTIGINDVPRGSKYLRHTCVAYKMMMTGSAILADAMHHRRRRWRLRRFHARTDGRVRGRPFLF